jgi:hypothetical protein
MYSKHIVEGAINPNTGERSAHPIERAVFAKHAHAGADFIRQHDDGSYDLVLPSAEHYADAIDEITASSEDAAVVADVLRRHNA